MTRRRYEGGRYELPREPRSRGPVLGPESTRLRPIRDTGLTLGGGEPPSRPRRRGRRRAANGWPLVLGGLVVLALVAGGVLALTRRSADGAPHAAQTQSVAYTLEALPDPTPAFATYRSMRISLPLRPEDTTAIGFHQASGGDALHVRSLVPDIKWKNASESRSQLRPAAVQVVQEGASPVLDGGVLRMWRSNRSGKPDSACDVGGKPGSQVYSPVSGTVTKVVRYKLYGKYGDYEIHIAPEGWPEVDVVLIHIDDVVVKAGTRVEAGTSPLARVRRLSHRVTHQLGQYTGDGGDHVHVQLNRVEVPGKVAPVGES